jgi:hypothetical protein
MQSQRIPRSPIKEEEGGGIGEREFAVARDLSIAIKSMVTYCYVVKKINGVRLGS